MRRRRYLLQAPLAAALLLTCSCTLLLPQPGGPQVESPDIDELSGLAVSRADPTLLWGHNDSGDRARLFRIGAHGEDLGDLPVPGAEAVDWEDIAAFDWQGEPALLIGDIGDNGATRDHLSLYAVSDPGRTGTALRLLWQIDFRYPDGARDCEALAVDPIDHAAILISKREHPPRLYRLPLPTRLPLPPGIAIAEALGPVTTLPRAGLGDLVASPVYRRFDGPTALDIGRAGHIAVVTTYKDAWLYRRADGQGWAAAFAAPPELIRLPHLRQTEAGAISLDGRSLVISGEGEHPPLLRVPLPP
ncbi:MAG: hypothetical protein NVS9B10_20060 [Nevskia sp.]